MASLFDDKEKYKNAIMSNWDATHILCHMEDLMQIFCNICNHRELIITLVTTPTQSTAYVINSTVIQCFSKWTEN